MANTNKKPNQFFSDKGIQKGLCIRVALYWFASQLVTLGVVAGMVYLERGSFSNSFRFVLPAMIMGAIAVPLAISDMLCFSNRFAGALLNFRRKFRAMADGGPTEKLTLRPNDFLHDICYDYNRLRDRLEDQSGVEEEVEQAEEVAAS